MKRLILLLGLLTASLLLAQEPPNLTFLPAGKSPEGMAVNPVTHKAYIVAEVEGTGRAVLVFDGTALNNPPKIIPIADETEYITVDSLRNRIYLSTRYGIESEDEGPEQPEGAVTAAGPNPGTLTAIDGNTDTVIATYQFPLGVEPEGVAVDRGRNVVYVGVKAPEVEPINGTCSSGTPLFRPGEDEIECWTAGTIYVFSGNYVARGPVKSIPAGDDPESVVFANNRVYAANEDDGTVTIAAAVTVDASGRYLSGGNLLTDTPVPSSTAPPYSLGVFYGFGPNTLACPENQYEADKMAANGYSVFLTDDRSRVARIYGTTVAGMVDIPGATACEGIPNSDGGGLNTANNVATLQGPNGVPFPVYAVSERNTVAMLDPTSLAVTATITIPGAIHLDAIGVESSNRVWITDEDLYGVFVLQGACANGTGPCTPSQAAPKIISDSTATFTIGSADTFSVIATGTPTPSVSALGALPSGLSFVPNGNGTATLAGTAAAGTAGSYPLFVTATNGISPDDSQTLVLTVSSFQGTPPEITSGNTTTFTVGSAGTFTVTTTGSPAPTLSYLGTLPGGVSFVDNGNGTATLTGTAGAGTQGSYLFTITATNGVAPDAVQTFALTVNPAPGVAPVITTANAATFTVGSAGSFTVVATGSPTPILSYTGTLPNGVSFSDKGNGTATLVGTPAASTQGSYPLTIIATNGVAPDAHQNFALTVNPSPGVAPQITSANAATFMVGTAGSFTVRATGSPTPILSYVGTLPNGVSFVDNRNGTATLTGTPAAMTQGTYPLTITATNGVLPNASQSFTLRVNASGVLTIVTTGLSNGKVGQPYAAQLEAQGGTPPYRWTALWNLPLGLKVSTAGLVSGTPTRAGTYSFTIRVMDSRWRVASKTVTVTIQP